MNQPARNPELENDLTGKTVGDFMLIRRLGRGGMADVYLAEQLSLKRNVALKVLFSDLAKDDSYVKRFQREAQAAAALIQDNIVQIYEIGEVDGIHFIAQEYVPGRNLKQYLTRFGAVEPVMAVNVISQVAMALQKASEPPNTVVHRDIKPENIMISTNGKVKVTDFGLARLHTPQAKDLTQVGITMGTPLYMSPEQVQGGVVDPRSDIYSLGVTAWHMLAGRPPFEAENAIGVALLHVNESAEPLAGLRPDLPQELCSLIEKMMAKSPDDRPANASELLREVRNIHLEVDEDWDTLIEKLAINETSRHPVSMTTPEKTLAVTRQLQEVMSGNLKPWWQRTRTLALVAVATFVATVLGIVASSADPPVDPLDVEFQTVEQPVKQESVLEQYRLAQRWFSNSEAHWLAVERYFPIEDAAAPNTTREYICLSKVRLGELYLANGRFKEALEVYDDLVDVQGTDDDAMYNLIGWAGRAVSHDGQNGDGRYDQQIRTALSRITSELDRLSGQSELYNAVEQLISKYRGDSGISTFFNHGWNSTS